MTKSDCQPQSAPPNPRLRNLLNREIRKTHEKIQSCFPRKLSGFAYFGYFVVYSVSYIPTLIQICCGALFWRFPIPAFALGLPQGDVPFAPVHLHARRVTPVSLSLTRPSSQGEGSEIRIKITIKIRSGNKSEMPPQPRTPPLHCFKPNRRWCSRMV